MKTLNEKIMKGIVFSMFHPKQAARMVVFQNMIADITKCTGKTEAEILHELRTTTKSIEDIRSNAFALGIL